MPPDLLTAFSDYLVAQGVVRKPRVPGPLPPLWLEPQEGVVAPGEPYPGGNADQIGQDVVLGVYRTGGFPQGPYESAWREPTIDLRIRARTAVLVTSTERSITPLIIDKREWMMGGLLVLDSEMWRPLQPIEINNQAFSFVVSYSFMIFGP